MIFMIFMTVGLVVAIIDTVLSVIMYIHDGGLEIFEAFISGVIAITLAAVLLTCCLEVRINKALIQSHLENPNNYTYTQLAEHNELVTKLRVWQGTIFSFYNDVDLQTIDINSVSQKVVVEPKMEK